MTATKRPRRQRKSDRLISPGATREEIMCDHALAPFDRVAREMDDRWGVERLPELVSVETAQKFGSAMAKLNAAIEVGDPTEVAARANVCIRGLHAMDAEAKGCWTCRSNRRILGTVTWGLSVRRFARRIAVADRAA